MDSNKGSRYTLVMNTESEADEWKMKEAWRPEEAVEGHGGGSSQDTGSPVDVQKSSTSSSSQPPHPKAVSLEFDYHGHDSDSTKSETMAKRQLEVESCPSRPSKRLRPDDAESAENINSPVGSMSPRGSISSTHSLCMDVDHVEPGSSHHGHSSDDGMAPNRSEPEPEEWHTQPHVPTCISVDKPEHGGESNVQKPICGELSTTEVDAVKESEQQTNKTQADRIKSGIIANSKKVVPLQASQQKKTLLSKESGYQDVSEPKQPAETLSQKVGTLEDADAKSVPGSIAERNDTKSQQMPVKEEHERGLDDHTYSRQPLYQSFLCEICGSCCPDHIALEEHAKEHVLKESSVTPQKPFAISDVRTLNVGKFAQDKADSNLQKEKGKADLHVQRQQRQLSFSMLRLDGNEPLRDSCKIYKPYGGQNSFLCDHCGLVFEERISFFQHLAKHSIRRLPAITVKYRTATRGDRKRPAFENNSCLLVLPKCSKSCKQCRSFVFLEKQMKKSHSPKDDRGQTHGLPPAGDCIPQILVRYDNDTTPKPLLQHAKDPKPKTVRKRAKRSKAKALPKRKEDSTLKPLLQHAPDPTPKPLLQHAKDPKPKTVRKRAKHSKAKALPERKEDSTLKPLLQHAPDPTQKPLLQHAKDPKPKTVRKRAKHSKAKALPKRKEDSTLKPLLQHAPDPAPKYLLQATKDSTTKALLQHADDSIHLPQHETRFKCSLCMKAFRFESQLLRHKNVHRLDSRRPVLESQQSELDSKDESTESTVKQRKKSKKRKKAKKRKKGREKGETYGWRFKIDRTGDATRSGRRGGSERDQQEPRLVSATPVNPVMDRRFPCGLCGKWFSSHAELETHMVIHSGFNCYQCEELTFASSAKLKRHLLTHSENPKKNHRPKSSAPKEITESPSKPKYSKSLQNEQLTAEAAAPKMTGGFEKRVFPCHLCGKVFSRNAQLKFHMVVHSDISCVLCDGLSFASSEELESHLLTHISLMKCEKEDSNPSEPRGNTKTPSKVDDRLQCSVFNEGSPKSLVPKGSTNSPSKVVKKLIYCSVCNKGFIRPCLLRKHMVVHSDSRQEPPKTETCRKKGPKSSVPKGSTESSVAKDLKSLQRRQPKGNKQSPTTSELKSVQSGQSKHRTKSSTATELKSVKSGQPKGSKKSSKAAELMSVSSGQPSVSAPVAVKNAEVDNPFSCLLCGRGFSHLTRLNMHKASMHSDFNCDQCDGLTFPSSEQLSSHMLTHTEQLKCPMCDATYTSQKSLSDHIASHSDPVPHICDMCLSVFNSQKSLKMHQIMNHSQAKMKNIIEAKEKESKGKRELVKKKKIQQKKRTKPK